MKAVEKSGRTVEEAVALALAELGVPRERVRVEVLSAPRPGIFGLLSRQAVVRVEVQDTRGVEEAPSKEAAGEPVSVFLQSVCRAMGLEMDVRREEQEEALRFELVGQDAGVLIGRHGQTLEALQFLAGLVASRGGVRKRVVLDVAGYRRRREEALVRLAAEVAERVRRTGQRVVLSPMPAHERRVIHMALVGNPHVRTASQGEEPRRRVVVEPRR